MKNTALVLTSSALATLCVLTGIYAVNALVRELFFALFWEGLWELDVLGWISLVIVCTSTVLAFFFASRERKNIAYGLAATAGVFLVITLDMISYMGMYVSAFG